MTLLRSTPVLLILGVLAACSSAPSADDVEQAMEANIRATIARQEQWAEQIGGTGATDFMHSLGVPEAHDIDISDVAIQHSTQLDSGDYRLDVTYKATVADVSRRSSTQVILGQRDGKWTVLN